MCASHAGCDNQVKDPERVMHGACWVVKPTSQGSCLLSLGHAVLTGVRPTGCSYAHPAAHVHVKAAHAARSVYFMQMADSFSECWCLYACEAVAAYYNYNLTCDSTGMQRRQCIQQPCRLGNSNDHGTTNKCTPGSAQRHRVRPS